ncbi:MAG: hypothetical protein ABJN42_12315 [Roseibium sp.]|uniref:hypothetical protein n=1 Tax=Roseibium sp. TaxID=1936156 RepID=UPI0032983458
MDKETFDRPVNKASRALNQLDWALPDGAAQPEINCPEEQALCGPDGDPSDVRFKTDAARSFDEVLEDLYIQFSSEPENRGSVRQHVGSLIRGFVESRLAITPPVMSADEGYHRIVTLKSPRDGEPFFAAISETPNDDHRIIGLLVGSEMAVDKTHQGLGFGTGLVAAALLETGTLPAWSSSDVSYTDAAASSVRRGLQLAQRLSTRPELEDTFEM